MAKNKGGRPPKLTPHMRDAARRYIYGFAAHDHATPSVVGMAVVLGVARATLYYWANHDRRFSDILQECNTHQEHYLADKGLKGEVNPTIAKLILGRHGYSENINNRLSGDPDNPVEVREIIRKVID